MKTHTNLIKYPNEKKKNSSCLGHLSTWSGLCKNYSNGYK